MLKFVTDQISYDVTTAGVDVNTIIIRSPCMWYIIHRGHTMAMVQVIVIQNSNLWCDKQFV